MGANSFLSIIEQYFKRNGGLTRLKGELAVYFWPRVAGAEFAQKVEAVRFRDGQLYLQTENPALAHQLTLMHQDILGRYRKLLGSGIVRAIKVKIGSTKSVSKLPEVVTEIHLSETEQQHIDDCTRPISDPELAVKFAGWMQRHYRNTQLRKLYGGGECPSCGAVIGKGLEFCPPCEIKLTEEVYFYLGYLQKKGQEIAATDLSQGLSRAHQALTARILQNSAQEE